MLYITTTTTMHTFFTHDGVEYYMTTMSRLLNNYHGSLEDMKDSYLLLLTELSITGYLETPLFVDNIRKILAMGEIVLAYVGTVGGADFEIIASGTILFESKLIREGRKVGHIEDVVVSHAFRGNEISQQLLTRLKELAVQQDCYKVTLACTQEVSRVYEKHDFHTTGVTMTHYFV